MRELAGVQADHAVVVSSASRPGVDARGLDRSSDGHGPTSDRKVGRRRGVQGDIGVCWKVEQVGSVRVDVQLSRVIREVAQPQEQLVVHDATELIGAEGVPDLCVCQWGDRVGVHGADTWGKAKRAHHCNPISIHVVFETLREDQDAFLPLRECLDGTGTAPPVLLPLRL